MPAAFEPLRPSADALLVEANRVGRGRLKIFLGAAPGVGKTFEMLMSAKAKLAQNMDVVAGIIETHGRAETQELLYGLPQIPRLQLEYRGRKLEEFDLDGMLKRRPQLALVDELAHTNVPGLRHAKRYQDIQELLDAGIDVFTTLNVQHLESFNDLVMRITGVEIRETVPDAIVEKAEVELIDLPPDELIERLRQGKVYVPEQARRALDNYFSRGNLLALRELALRAAAERVDDDLSTFMRAHGIEGPWPARGRLLVCIDATPGSETLLRGAKRLADQRHLAWTALYVQTLGTMLSAAAQRQLDLNLILAAQLGGETATLTAERVGMGVLDYARAHNVAQIVVGRPRARRWQRLFRGSLAQWLFEQGDDFEVTVVGTAERLSQEESRIAVAMRKRQPLLRVRDVVMTCAISAAATLLAWAASPWMDADNLSSVFLIAVAVAGSIAGLAAALFASGLCFLAFNFFFTDPRFTLLVYDPSDVRALVAFVIVAVVVGLLAGRLKRQAADAERNALRTELLFEFARRLATAVNEKDLRHAAATGIEEILQVRCVVLESNASMRIDVPSELAHSGTFGDTDQAAAEWTLQHSEPAGVGTTTLPGASWSFLPVGHSTQTWGVIGLQGRGGAELGSEDRRLLFSLQSQLAAAWERLRLRRIAEDAKLQRTAESLRSALLASVSHDLRTPLVSIIGSLTAVRDMAGQLPPQDHAELIQTALDEAERLNRLIQNLLDATRLAQGGLPLRLAPVYVPEVVAGAVTRLPAIAARVVNEVGEYLPAVRADRALLEQTMVNLLENAGKYSPQEMLIRVAAEVHAAAVRIRVIDRGLGIAPTERHRIFDFFFRAEQRDSGVPGSGLGLAISRGFVEAMGGTIKALPGEDGQGTIIEIELPIDESSLSSTHV